MAAEQKTKPTDVNVLEWLGNVMPEQKRNDCLELVDIFKKVTKMEPVMWGTMVGYGHYHYKYESGHEGDCFMTGFAPRKQNIVIYMMPGFNRYEELMQQLGKYKTGKSCLYLNKLADVDKKVLTRIIKESFTHFCNTIKAK